MSFGVRRPGQPIQAGNAAEFHGGATMGAVLTGDGFSNNTVPVAVMGENMIARSDAIRRQGPERVMAGAPKFWKVTNRAKQGHIQVWRGVFDGEAFPQDSNEEDKRSWLQPGDSMMLPLDAALHFFGNVFDPRAPEAMEIIERSGGFELETQRANPGRNAEVRVIGGPIGLPDFVITPIDGRLKPVGQGIELYSHYWGAVRKKVLKTRKDSDPEIIKAEQSLLADRIREYTLEEEPDFEPLYDGSGRVASTAASRAADGIVDETPDMKKLFADGEPEEIPGTTEELPVATAPTRRGGRPATT